MKVGTTKCNEIDKEWKELKKILKTNTVLLKKIRKLKKLFFKVLKFQYGSDETSWPKNKGLAMTYEALTKVQDDHEK